MKVGPFHTRELLPIYFVVKRFITAAEVRDEVLSVAYGYLRMLFRKRLAEDLDEETVQRRIFVSLEQE